MLNIFFENMLQLYSCRGMCAESIEFLATTQLWRIFCARSAITHARRAVAITFETTSTASDLDNFA